MGKKVSKTESCNFFSTDTANFWQRYYECSKFKFHHFSQNGGSQFQILHFWTERQFFDSPKFWRGGRSNCPTPSPPPWPWYHWSLPSTHYHDRTPWVTSEINVNWYCIKVDMRWSLQGSYVSKCRTMLSLRLKYLPHKQQQNCLNSECIGRWRLKSLAV